MLVALVVQVAPQPSSRDEVSNRTWFVDGGEAETPTALLVIFENVDLFSLQWHR